MGRGLSAVGREHSAERIEHGAGCGVHKLAHGIRRTTQGKKIKDDNYLGGRQTIDGGRAGHRARR